MSYQQDVFQLISSFTGHNANYVIPKEFMRLVKDSNAALILSQLVYWTGKGTDQDGWIYKSYKEWDEEIFLSQKVIMTAVKKIKKLGIVETEVRKIKLPNGMLTNQTCVHYRVDQGKLAELMINQLKSLGNAEREFPGNSEEEFPKNAEREFPSIITKNTSKNTATTPPPDPGPVEPDSPEPSSSLLSEDQIIKTLARLFSLVPKQFLKPSVRQTIEKALIIHSKDYAESAIKYTNDHTDGSSWQRYRAYLDKTINYGYADGYQSDQAEQVDTEARKKAFLESRRSMPDSILKADAANGCQVSQQVLQERRAEKS